jgi:hypothetical protein
MEMCLELVDLSLDMAKLKGEQAGSVKTEFQHLGKDNDAD